MQDSNGINSLRQAREILEKYAPEGERLAYINDDEARLLKYMGELVYQLTHQEYLLIF